MESIYRIKSRGPRMEPYGTPEEMLAVKMSGHRAPHTVVDLTNNWRTICREDQIHQH